MCHLTVVAQHPAPAGQEEFYTSITAAEPLIDSAFKKGLLLSAKDKYFS